MLHNNTNEELTLIITNKQESQGGFLIMVLAVILLIVALLSVVSVIRQLKFKNVFAIGFSAISALTFGYFSVSTIICEVGLTSACSLLTIS